jgi:hypothetical protein
MYVERLGESIFGSLTNWLGDRIKTILISTTIIRMGVRIYIRTIFL